MTNQLATIETSMKALAFNSEEIQFIKDKYAPNATEIEFKEFIALCQMIGANPMLKEIYFIKYGSGDQGKASIVKSYLFKIKQANATGLFQGFTNPEYLDDKSNWLDAWPWDTTQRAPLACRVGVRRKDWQLPQFATINWRDRVKNQAEWKNQAVHMLTKCTESAALDLAFGSLIGMPILEEIETLPEPEWTNDPAKTKVENAIDAGRAAKEALTEKNNFKAGDLKPEKITPDQAAKLKDLWEILDYDADMRVKFTIREIGKSKGFTVSEADQMVAALEAELKARDENPA